MLVQLLHHLHSLSYTNGETGSCEISGSVTGVVTGSQLPAVDHTLTLDIYRCTITGQITATRTITPDQHHLPFICYCCKPITTQMCLPFCLSCSSFFIIYKWVKQGVYEISGSVTGTITGTACGGSTETWTFILLTGPSLLQELSQFEPAPVAVFATAPNLTITCAAAAGAAPAQLLYHIQIIESRIARISGLKWVHVYYRFSYSVRWILYRDLDIY